MKVLLACCFLFLSLSNTFAHVILDSPVGGENFDANEIIVIKWHIQITHPQENWDLYFSTDSGSTWEELAIDLPTDQKSFSWTIPNIETSQARIKIVMDNVAANYEDESNDFSIGVFIPLVLNYPMGGESFTAGSTERISWEVNGFVTFDFWNLDFSIDGGDSWTTLSENISPAILSYDWVVPQMGSTQGRVRLEMIISSTVFENISGVFTISEEVITALKTDNTHLSEIRVYPNPFSESTTIQISIVRSSDIGLTIYNQTGRAVFSEEYVNLHPGFHNLDWSPENIPSGLYFYQLHTANGIDSGKLLYNK